MLNIVWSQLHFYQDNTTGVRDMPRILKYKYNISPFVWELLKVDFLAMFIFTLGLCAKFQIFIFNRSNVFAVLIIYRILTNSRGMYQRDY